MLAGSQGRDGGAGVQGHGQRNVDGVDARVSDGVFYGWPTARAGSDAGLDGSRVTNPRSTLRGSDWMAGITRLRAMSPMPATTQRTVLISSPE